MNLGLQDKHIIVTGASGGIGKETLKTFLAESTRITATYHTNREPLLQLVHNNNQNRVALVQTDVRNEDSVRNLFAEADSKFGRVDVLVANAGIAHGPAPIHKMSFEQWEETMNVNLAGAFLCAKHFFKNLERYPEDTASLILIGSTAGLFGEANYADYASSKAALHGLMMSLKNEIVHLAPRGRVNLVNPGWTMTPMAQSTLQDPETLKRILQTIPMQKVATPSDIANTILALASDIMTGHISGETVTVAGGMEGRILFDRDEIDIEE
ncbi:MAG: SDR family oxidoreductase [Candidatus Thorarchaeota archaeon]|nr:SDR family oxidoreductase [Candidatus Thorarchaeota archaeon]